MWTNNQLRILIDEIRKITNATTIFLGKGIYKNQSLLGTPYSGGRHCKEKFQRIVWDYEVNVYLLKLEYQSFLAWTKSSFLLANAFISIR